MGLLDRKIALITGAASGIGRAAALAFTREGAKLTIADIAAKGGEETANMVRNAGGEVEFIRCDVSKSVEVTALIDAVVKRYGRVDCSFNNAGIEGEVLHLADDTEENFDRVIAIDLKAVFLCMKYEIRQMLNQETGGAIVNTASTAGLVGAHGMPAYTAAKHGVVGLTKQMAVVYSARGVTINAVCPGPILTNLRQHSQEILGAGVPDMSGRGIAVNEDAIREIVPAGRRGTVEDIASAVCYLASDEAAYITGHAMVVDGGWRAK
jgi:NAD(P)-dependent dehydrogenase (short-subunit alcohol dehydrogenase family)